MDVGNALIERLRKPDPGSDANVAAAVKQFHDMGHAAVLAVDEAELPRYNAPLRGRTVVGDVAERLERLQAIQDRL